MSGNCAGECALRDDLQNADERNEKANNIIMAIAYGTPTKKYKSDSFDASSIFDDVIDVIVDCVTIKLKK